MIYISYHSDKKPFCTCLSYLHIYYYIAYSRIVYHIHKPFRHWREKFLWTFQTSLGLPFPRAARQWIPSNYAHIHIHIQSEVCSLYFWLTYTQYTRYVSTYTHTCSLKSVSIDWNRATNCSSIKLAGICITIRQSLTVSETNQFCIVTWSMSTMLSKALASLSFRRFSVVPPSPSTALRTCRSHQEVRCIRYYAHILIYLCDVCVCMLVGALLMSSFVPLGRALLVSFHREFCRPTHRPR